jgi:hypothetical protein
VSAVSQKRDKKKRNLFRSFLLEEYKMHGWLNNGGIWLLQVADKITKPLCLDFGPISTCLFTTNMTNPTPFFVLTNRYFKAGL